jgi:hypothetical protein
VRADEHARRAIAALQRVPARESRLQIGDRAGIRKAFNGFDFRTVALHSEEKTRAHGFAAKPYRTRAANAVFAAHMSAGQGKVFAKEVDQRFARFDTRGNGLAVDAHANIEVARAHFWPGSAVFAVLIASEAGCVMQVRWPAEALRIC